MRVVRLGHTCINRLRDKTHYAPNPLRSLESRATAELRGRSPAIVGCRRPKLDHWTCGELTRRTTYFPSRNSLATSACGSTHLNQTLTRSLAIKSNCGEARHQAVDALYRIVRRRTRTQSAREVNEQRPACRHLCLRHA